MVTIARFYWPAQAYMARCRLAACGIEAWVPDEYTSSLYWHYSNGLGGIRLQVRSDDVEDARAVLDEDQQHAEEPILTDNEQAAERALRSAIFGALNPLFYIWSAWLLVQVLLSWSRISAIQRRNILLAVILIAFAAAPIILLTTVLFRSAWRN